MIMGWPWGVVWVYYFLFIFSKNPSPRACEGGFWFFWGNLLGNPARWRGFPTASAGLERRHRGSWEEPPAGTDLGVWKRARVEGNGCVTGCREERCGERVPARRDNGAAASRKTGGGLQRRCWGVARSRRGGFRSTARLRGSAWLDCRASRGKCGSLEEELQQRSAAGKGRSSVCVACVKSFFWNY